MCLTPELEQTMRTIIREEIEQRERDRAANRNMYRRICEEYEEKLKRFDYIETWDRVSSDGQPYQDKKTRCMAYKLRAAIGTLLRAVYQVQATAALPLAQEAEIRGFITTVLTLMEETQPKNKTSLRLVATDAGTSETD